MNYRKMKKLHAHHITRPWQWVAQHHENFPVIPKKSYDICDYEKLPKESMLTEELSDVSSGGNSSDWGQVRKGFLAVYVGPELRRFVIPTSYLSLPEFRVLMDKTAEEFGFEQQGGLQIPCDEQDFELILDRCVALHQKSKNKNHKKI